ncbi:MAG: hypothetical protein ACYTKD_23195 [Planctomycetota bacterium]
MGYLLLGLVVYGLVAFNTDVAWPHEETLEDKIAKLDPPEAPSALEI